MCRRPALRGRFGPVPEGGPGEVDAGHLEDEVLASALEGGAEVADGVVGGAIGRDLDEGEDEPLGLVETGEDLVAADGDDRGADDAALDLARSGTEPTIRDP